MSRGRNVYLFAVLFLAIAIISGRWASSGDSEGNRTASEALSKGTGEIGTVIADILWLQLDRYHHIWMYQGNNWETATDYLPQLWMITKLNPDFEDAYIDGAYHLAVNLGEIDEGVRLLSEGARNCPDSERILWETLVIYWETGYMGYEGTTRAAWDYLMMVRRKQGDIEEPWNEANAAMILEFTFSDDSTRSNHMRIAERYAERCQLVRYARDMDLWTR